MGGEIIKLTAKGQIKECALRIFSSSLAILLFLSFPNLGNLTNQIQPIEIVSINWGTSPEQIGLFKGPDRNYGPRSFTLDEEGGKLYLLDSENHRILVYDLNTKQFISVLSISGRGDDICLDDENSNIYVLYASEKKIEQISLTGAMIATHYFLQSKSPVVGISFYDNNLFIETADQTSYPITLREFSIQIEKLEEKAIKGLQRGGELIFIEKKNNLEGIIKFFNDNGKVSKEIPIYKKQNEIETLSLIGIDNQKNIYVVAEEKNISNKINRYLKKYNKDGRLLSEILIPYSDYAFTFKDLLVTKTGKVYQILPLKEHVKVLLWNLLFEITGFFNIDYKMNLTENFTSQENFFFKIFSKAEDFSNDQFYEVGLASIERNNIIYRAQEYADFYHYISSSNITTGIYCYEGNLSKWVVTPVTQPGNYTGVRYKWGGFSGLSGVTSYTDCSYFYYEGLSAGKYAGDKDTSTSYGICCAVGVDCSGFVSQAWGLSSKASTQTLLSISWPLCLKDDMVKGDILLYPGVHVMLFWKREADGKYTVYESSGVDWKVSSRSYSASQIQNYSAYRYKYIIFNDFQVGKRIKVVVTGLNVRSCPGTSCGIITSVSCPTTGTIIGGPQTADGYKWWQIAYDNGYTGWSAEAGLNILSDTPPYLEVTPTDGLSSSGQVGGPFSPSSKAYALQNTGGSSLNWTASKTKNWVSLSSTGGNLNPGQSTTVTVSINSNANSLAAGTYTDTVTFTNTTNGAGNTTRQVTLTVLTAPGWLTVTPNYGYNFWMFKGGPPPIPTGTYSLQNTGGTAINWQITKTASWLSISSPTSGTLDPGASTSKTISINSNSLTLTEGNYSDTLTFTNTTNGNGNTTRSVSLDVNYNMWTTVRGTTNQIYQRELTTGGSLLSWRALAGYTNKAPASVLFINRCYIIVKSDINNDIWYNFVNPNAARTLGPWTKLDGATPDKPAAAVFNNKLWLVVRGDDNRIYYRYMTTDGSWSAWSTVPGGYTNASPAIAAFNNYLYLIVKDTSDNKIWWNKMNTSGTWSGWQLMDGLSPSTAAMTEFNGQLYIVVRGSDNRLYIRSMNTSELFTAWRALTGWTDDSPAICSFNNLLYLVVKGLGSNNIWYNNMTTGGIWGSWTKIDGASPLTASVVAPQID